MASSTENYGLDGLAGTDVASMPEPFRAKYVAWSAIAPQVNRSAVIAQHAIAVDVEVETEWLDSVCFSRILAFVGETTNLRSWARTLKQGSHVRQSSAA